MFESLDGLSIEETEELRKTAVYEVVATLVNIIEERTSKDHLEDRVISMMQKEAETSNDKEAFLDKYYKIMGKEKKNLEEALELYLIIFKLLVDRVNDLFFIQVGIEFDRDQFEAGKKKIERKTVEDILRARAFRISNSINPKAMRE